MAARLIALANLKGGTGKSTHMGSLSTSFSPEPGACFFHRATVRLD